MRYFCTLFDSNYQPHAMSLADSLTAHSDEFRLFMFCMDEAAYSFVSATGRPELVPISLHELEEYVPGLLAAKANRSRVEYFYTCSPAICHFSLNKFAGVSEITYLDADLFFFSNPAPIFREINGASVAIIEHRYARRRRLESRYGRYNVAWITFRKNDSGTACLEDWLSDCIEWCYQRVEEGKYADQKYLDQWPHKYDGVHVIQHPGANVAPWNVSNHPLSAGAEGVKVGNRELIFYHFAGLSQVDQRRFRTGLSSFRVRTSGILRDQIYTPYARSLVSYLPASEINAKSDIHVSGVARLLRGILHRIRQSLFSDLIAVDEGNGRVRRA